ncbi:hypothetical protein [Lentzea terrae]|uniref:hypothetical protein n=1 Tax=Lentzea terrae TaxID=2200761 RepID=UPI000DD466A5|nr:hypothetical protein [Lentzea terrae]
MRLASVAWRATPTALITSGDWLGVVNYEISYADVLDRVVEHAGLFGVLLEGSATLSPSDKRT